MTTRGWRAGWRTSTRSNNGTDCIEVDVTSAGVQVRDSKAHGAGPIITFTPTQWTAFITGTRDGEFDYEAHVAALIG